MTRWLVAAFVALTVIGSAALSMTGCDDDVEVTQDLSVLPDLRSAHD